jgi:undecaprenyl-diphosphatase
VVGVAQPRAADRDVAAFGSVLLVVRCLLDFVSRHGFAPFAYWRIALGVAGLAALALVGSSAGA